VPHEVGSLSICHVCHGNRAANVHNKIALLMEIAFQYGDIGSLYLLLKPKSKTLV